MANPPGRRVTIGGTVSGLATGASVVLQNNGGSNLTVRANGNFTFATPVNSGATYAVTVSRNPSRPDLYGHERQWDGDRERHERRGNSAQRPAGPDVHHWRHAQWSRDRHERRAAEQRRLEFDGERQRQLHVCDAVNSGATYAVTVLTHPWSNRTVATCTVATGRRAANVTNVAINCVTGSYGVSGTVSGLIGRLCCGTMART